MVRGGLGLGIVLALALTPPDDLADPDGLLWILLGLTVWEIPGAWRILFGLRGGRVIATVVVTVGISIGVIAFVSGNGLWTTLLHIYGYAWLIGVLGTQAISFLLAALIRTPGCEWRAIPHFIANLRGRSTHFTNCRLGLEDLDMSS